MSGGNNVVRQRLWTDPQTGQQYVIRNGYNVKDSARGSVTKTRCCGGGCASGDCVVGGLIFLAVVVAAIGVLSGIALNYSLYTTRSRIYTADGVIDNDPFAIYLDSTAPLSMTLPNDLSNYVGRTFTVISQSAHAHTITLSAGTLTSTWDGGNTVATFGGAIGDALTFHVFDHDKISVISNTNIVFS